MFRRPRQVFHGLKHKVCPARHVSGPTQHKVRPVRHLFAWMKRKDRPANLKGGGALLEKHAPRQARRPPRLPAGRAGRPPLRAGGAGFQSRIEKPGPGISLTSGAGATAGFQSRIEKPGPGMERNRPRC